jgi:hypothetical protein
MSYEIARLALQLLIILLCAGVIRDVIRAFLAGKYYVVGVSVMLTVWAICLFVRVFFGL